MKRPTAFCAGPTARRGCIRSLQTSELSEHFGERLRRLPRPASPWTAPLPTFGHPLPALRGEGRERGANLVHGPNACAKAKERMLHEGCSRWAAILAAGSAGIL